MNDGDLVWWWHTETLPLFGHVCYVEERPGVKVVGTSDVLYLDAEQLHAPEELPDGVYRGFPYHANTARLSPSTAKKLIKPGGPAKYDWERKNGQKPKPAWDFGKVAHELVLGEGDQFVVLSPELHGLKKDGTLADNPRATTSWRQAETQARAEGLTPIAYEDYERAIAMAQAVHGHPEAAKLLAHGDAEQWLYATDPETGQGLRIRVDWMTEIRGRLNIVEYKTAADADPETFSRKAYDYGYHIACVLAIICARALQLDESPVYRVIAQEKEPPYLVSVCEFDLDSYLLGKRQVREAIDTFRRCTETGEWPGYGSEIHTLSLPPWAFPEEEMVI